MPDQLPAMLIQPGELHQLYRPGLPFLFGNPVEPALVFQDLFYTHVISQGIFLGHDCYFLFHFHMVTRQLLPIRINLTGCRQHQCRQNADHGGLACTIGAKQAKELTIFDG